MSTLVKNRQILSRMKRYLEILAMRLDDPVPNDDFTLLDSFGIQSSVSVSFRAKNH
jgi:hypothetical protein